MYLCRESIIQYQLKASNYGNCYSLKDAERFIAKAEEAEKNTKQRINVSRNIKLVKDFLRKQNL